MTTKQKLDLRTTLEVARNARLKAGPNASDKDMVWVHMFMHIVWLTHNNVGKWY